MDDSYGLSHQQRQHTAGIPYPFSELPALGAPFSDVQLMDTLSPLLAGLAGMARALAVVSLDDVPLPMVQDALRLLAAQTAAAETILRRWGDARDEGC